MGILSVGLDKEWVGKLLIVLCNGVVLRLLMVFIGEIEEELLLKLLIDNLWLTSVVLGI